MSIPELVLRERNLQEQRRLARKQVGPEERMVSAELHMVQNQLIAALVQYYEQREGAIVERSLCASVQ